MNEDISKDKDDDDDFSYTKSILCLPFLFHPSDEEECLAMEKAEQILCYSSHNSLYLLTGPPNSGKTSLSFHYGYRIAKESSIENAVLFICSRRKIQTKLPLHPKGLLINPTIMQHIKFKYIEDDTKLRFFIGSIHEWPGGIPELVIIDDFSAFFPRGKDIHSMAPMARTLAFIQEATEYAITKRPKFHMLITEEVNSDFIAWKKDLMQRWLPQTLLIQGEHSPHKLTVIDDPLKTELLYDIGESGYSLQNMLYVNPNTYDDDDDDDDDNDEEELMGVENGIITDIQNDIKKNREVVIES